MLGESPMSSLNADPATCPPDRALARSPRRSPAQPRPPVGRPTAPSGLHPAAPAPRRRQRPRQVPGSIPLFTAVDRLGYAVAAVSTAGPTPTPGLLRQMCFFSLRGRGKRQRRTRVASDKSSQR
uniref:Uncharacterized protein n=1 Tax=Arundo donax TaxID=35708 RepID=A0A0A8ZZG3_ARUDO